MAVTLAGGAVPLTSSHRPTATMTTAAAMMPARLGVAGEQLVETVEQPGDGERHDEPDEHRQPADRRHRRSVHAALVRLVEPAEPAGEAAHERRGRERHDGRNGTDDEVVTGCRHGPRSYGRGPSPLADATAESIPASELGFECRDLVDPPGVPAALERGGQEQCDDLLGEPDADDAAHPSPARWRRCGPAPSGPCTARCTARPGHPVPCSPRAAHPARCRRPRCRGRRHRRGPPGRRPRRTAGSRHVGRVGAHVGDLVTLSGEQRRRGAP